MSPDLLAGLVLGAMAGAFGIALIPCGHAQEKADPGPPPEKPHNMLGKPKPYDPNNCWCGKSHPGYGHNRVDASRVPTGKPGEVLVPESRGAIAPHLPPENPVPPSERPPAADMPRLEFYSEGGMILSRCVECKGVKKHAPECSDSGIYQELKADPDLIGRPV